MAEWCERCNRREGVWLVNDELTLCDVCRKADIRREHVEESRGDHCVLSVVCESSREAEAIGSAVTWTAMAMGAQNVVWSALRLDESRWELNVAIQANPQPERFEGDTVADLIEYGHLE